MKGREVFIELEYKYQVSARHITMARTASSPQKGRVVLIDSSQKLAI